MQLKSSKRPRGGVKGLGVVIIFTLLLLFLPGTVQAQQEEDFFYSNGEKYSVSISLTSIGILARDGVSAGRLRTLADSLDLRLIRELPGGIFVLGLDDTLTRGELVNYAWEIRDRHDEIVAQAGLVVTPVDAEVPLIVSDEFIAQFHAEVVQERIDSLNEANRVVIITENPYVPNQFLLRITKDSELDALQMANRYHESPLAEFAHPNFIHVTEWQQLIPNDRLFGDQWHLRNTGQGGGTIDADIDAELAWDITTGGPGVIIAVIDQAFDTTHQDLRPNLWMNPGEIDDGLDNDGNLLVDDIRGWDFMGCDATLAPIPCGDNDPSPTSWIENHGTAVAGVAGAPCNNPNPTNAIGVSGSCPECNLMLIRKGNTAYADEQAFRYALDKGADIITNSWLYSIPSYLPTIVSQAIEDVTAAGVVVLFAAGNNTNLDVCTGPNRNLLVCHDSIIAVSSSTNLDRKAVGRVVGSTVYKGCSIGDSIDILAPSWHRDVNTLGITITDRSGNAGYNNTAPLCVAGLLDPAPPPADARDYTNCFSGTSSATPLTAGVVGLILSVNSNLTRKEIQHLLQDCADKIEPGVAAYDPNTGFSDPATGVATHSWGRLNAFEAVRVAAPVADGGKGGVDIFLRDNYLDWGNTEQPSNTLFETTRGFIGHWASMDIKVDAHPINQPVPTTSADFDALTDETPVLNKTNRVYIRVRNRGPVTANPVTVKLHWTQFGTALPNLPSDFWTAWPSNSSNTTDWHPLQCSGTSSYTCTINNLKYSGSSVAATAADDAQIVKFDFTPTYDPNKPNHFCLLAMIDSPQDRILPESGVAISFNEFVVDQLTPNDNNVTHKNYINLSTTWNTSFESRFYVRNPLDMPIQAVLGVRGLPEGWKLESDVLDFNQPFVMQPGQEILVTAKVVTPELGLEGDVTIIQKRTDVDPSEIMGGITYHFYGEPERPRKFSISVHSGVATPFDSLANDFGTGLNVLADLDYHFTKNWSIVGFAGYNSFKSQVTGVDDDYWLNFSLNGRFNQPIANVVSPYVQLGPGYYVSGSGNSGFGVNAGVGIDYLFKPWLTIEAGADYHRVFNQNIQFIHSHAGVIFRF